MGPTAQPRLFVNRATSTWRAAAAALYDITRYHRLVHHAGPRSTTAHAGTHTMAVAAARRLIALRLRAIANDGKLGIHSGDGESSPQPRPEGDSGAYGLPRGNAGTPHLRDWLIDLQLVALNDASYAYDHMLQARAQARRLEAQCARAAGSEWRRWIHSGPAAGLGRQHAYSRLPHGWVPSRVANRSAVPAWRERDEQEEACWLRKRILEAGDDGTMRPLNAQEAVDAEAIDWSEHWLSGRPQPRPEWPPTVPLPGRSPTPSQLREAACTFHVDLG